MYSRPHGGEGMPVPAQIAAASGEAGHARALMGGDEQQGFTPAGGPNHGKPITGIVSSKPYVLGSDGTQLQQAQMRAPAAAAATNKSDNIGRTGNGSGDRDQHGSAAEGMIAELDAPAYNQQQQQQGMPPSSSFAMPQHKQPAYGITFPPTNAGQAPQSQPQQQPQQPQPQQQQQPHYAMQGPYGHQRGMQPQFSVRPGAPMPPQMLPLQLPMPQHHMMMMQQQQQQQQQQQHMVPSPMGMHPNQMGMHQGQMGAPPMMAPRYGGMGGWQQQQPPPAQRSQPPPIMHMQMGGFSSGGALPPAMQGYAGTTQSAPPPPPQMTAADLTRITAEHAAEKAKRLELPEELSTIQAEMRAHPLSMHLQKSRRSNADRIPVAPALPSFPVPDIHSFPCSAIVEYYMTEWVRTQRLFDLHRDKCTVCRGRQSHADEGESAFGTCRVCNSRFSYFCLANYRMTKVGSGRRPQLVPMEEVNTTADLCLTCSKHSCSCSFCQYDFTAASERQQAAAGGQKRVKVANDDMHTEWKEFAGSLRADDEAQPQPIRCDKCSAIWCKECVYGLALSIKPFFQSCAALAAAGAPWRCEVCTVSSGKIKEIISFREFDGTLPDGKGKVARRGVMYLCTMQEHLLPMDSVWVSQNVTMSLAPRILERLYDSSPAAVAAKRTLDRNTKRAFDMRNWQVKEVLFISEQTVLLELLRRPLIVRASPATAEYILGGKKGWEAALAHYREKGAYWQVLHSHRMRDPRPASLSSSPALFFNGAVRLPSPLTRQLGFEEANFFSESLAVMELILSCYNSRQDLFLKDFGMERLWVAVCMYVKTLNSLTIKGAKGPLLFLVDDDMPAGGAKATDGEAAHAATESGDSSSSSSGGENSSDDDIGTGEAMEGVEAEQARAKESAEKKAKRERRKRRPPPRETLADRISLVLRAMDIEHMNLHRTAEQFDSTAEFQEYLSLSFQYKLTHPSIPLHLSQKVVTQQVLICSPAALEALEELLGTVSWHTVVATTDCLMRHRRVDRTMAMTKSIPVIHRILISDYCIFDTFAQYKVAQRLKEQFFEPSSQKFESVNPAVMAKEQQYISQRFALDPHFGGGRSEDADPATSASASGAAHGRALGEGVSGDAAATDEAVNPAKRAKRGDGAEGSRSSGPKITFDRSAFALPGQEGGGASSEESEGDADGKSQAAPRATKPGPAPSWGAEASRRGRGVIGRPRIHPIKPKVEKVPVTAARAAADEVIAAEKTVPAVRSKGPAAGRGGKVARPASIRAKSAVAAVLAAASAASSDSDEVRDNEAAELETFRKELQMSDSDGSSNSRGRSPNGLRSSSRSGSSSERSRSSDGEQSPYLGKAVKKPTGGGRWPGRQKARSAAPAQPVPPPPPPTVGQQPHWRKRQVGRPSRAMMAAAQEARAAAAAAANAAAHATAVQRLNNARSSQKIVYTCQWAGCTEKFAKQNLLLMHLAKEHLVSSFSITKVAGAAADAASDLDSFLLSRGRESSPKPSIVGGVSGPSGGAAVSGIAVQGALGGPAAATAGAAGSGGLGASSTRASTMKLHGSLQLESVLNGHLVLRDEDASLFIKNELLKDQLRQYRDELYALRDQMAVQAAVPPSWVHAAAARGTSPTAEAETGATAAPAAETSTADGEAADVPLLPLAAAVEGHTPAPAVTVKAATASPVLAAVAAAAEPAAAAIAAEYAPARNNYDFYVNSSASQKRLVYRPPLHTGVRRGIIKVLGEDGFEIRPRRAQ